MASLFALRVLCTSATLGVVFAAAPALAAGTKAEQQARYRDAHRAISQKDWTSARELLLPLWAESPTYDVASSLAQVEYQLGDYPNAATYMAFALEHVAPVEDPQTVERMRLGMMELRGKVGGLRLRVNHVSAQVLLDGQSVARELLGREQFVVPGRHLIEARSAESAPARQELDVLAGQTYTVELDLRPALVPSSPERSSRPIAPDLRPSALNDRAVVHKPWWPALLGGSVAAVGFGVAIGYGVVASEAKGDWRQLRGSISSSGCAEEPASLDCRELRQAIDRQRSAVTWSTVGVGVGAVSAVATAAYLLLWPSPSPSAVEPSVNVGAQSAFVGLSGRF